MKLARAVKRAWKVRHWPIFRGGKILLDVYRARTLKAYSPVAFAEHLRRNGALHHIGEHCAINPNASITDPHLLSIGNNVRLSVCTIMGHDGSVNMINRMAGTTLDSVGPVTIGDNVFVGLGAIILPGTSIGSDTIIGAGAVVKGNLAGGYVYGGVPAKPICTIETYVRRLEDRNSKFPWTGLIAERGDNYTPAGEAMLARLRIAHFFGSSDNPLLTDQP